MKLPDVGLSEKTWNLGEEPRKIHEATDQVQEPPFLWPEGSHESYPYIVV